MRKSGTKDAAPKVASKESYIIEISDSLHKKIDKIVRVLNTLDNRKQSKKNWVLEAVQEKLSTVNQQHGEIVSPKHLNLSFDDEVKAKLNEIVTFQKKFRRTFSKKKWILEAIYEKIEREETKADDLLQTFKNTLQNAK